MNQPQTRGPGSLAELCAHFPAFANPVRPRTPQRPKRAGQRARERAIAASDALCVQEFARIDSAAVRARFANSAQGLVGPFAGAGDCLGRVFEPGSACWFDSTVAACDRDFVLVWVSDQYAAQCHRSRLAMKLLRFFDGEPYLLHVDGGVPLLDCRVLGVLRYIAAAARELLRE